ncbi:hypothetical protein AMTR_s00103p00132050 [Amborella trichopoda]|uniref:Uncharacterized protein n=1 Tax=Amborella trichopoda TaxID=13333 RepID=W1NZS8_AMBTC|nr:hypothetical protein AMTR_s00103p00132050 [Amborella trichopoda]
MLPNDLTRARRPQAEGRVGLGPGPNQSARPDKPSARLGKQPFSPIMARSSLGQPYGITAGVGVAQPIATLT